MEIFCFPLFSWVPVVVGCVIRPAEWGEKQKVHCRLYWDGCTWLVCISSVAGPKRALLRQKIHARAWLAQEMSFNFINIISSRLFGMALGLCLLFASCFWIDFFLTRFFSLKVYAFFFNKILNQTYDAICSSSTGCSSSIVVLKSANAWGKM